jgi:two-component system OmpR family response regulator
MDIEAMRILLVEDDEMIGAAIVQALKDDAHAADWVCDGDAALAALAAREHDAMLLDLNLPGRDGLMVLRGARGAGYDLPVLVLTARMQLDDRVTGLDAGADDYLVKPFDLPEMLARLRAITRRQGKQLDATLVAGALRVDPILREAQFGELSCRLSAREFALISALMMRPGAILSRGELERKIYGWNEEVESNAVEFLIHGIRKKLGANVIKNVRGVGWMIDPSVAPDR